MYRRFLSICLILSLTLLMLFLFHSTLTLAGTPSSIQGLHVSGNAILNGANQQIRLVGVNRAGGEYMCIQGRGIWDGPTDAASVQAIASWATNAIRIPLNEDCWLNINGVNSAMGGATYQQAVMDYVNLVNSFGLVAILDLHWTNAGTTPATAQQPIPDLDHAPAFWQSVATTFKSNSSVIFDVFNEPYPDSNSDTTAGWVCWRDGGTCPGSSYPVAGMQTLVTTIRNTGATNIIMLGGLEYSNALSQWLTYKPNDPAGNLVASWHSYNFNLCANVVCWNKQVLPIIQQVPLIAGEIGENDCAHGYIDPLMNWLDSSNTSYLAWTWDAWTNFCAQGPVLITDYAGTPTAYGQGFKDHLALLKQNWTATPTNTWTPGGPTATPTRTFTPTFTATPTNTPVTTGVLRVQVFNNGLDNTQESDFSIKTINTGSSAISAVSFRLYFTADFGVAASNYVIDRYNEYVNGTSSPASTITGPTLAFGSTYYYTFTFGGTSLPAGGGWELTGRIRLSDWSTNNIASNDWYHTIFPTAYADTIYIPAYINGVIAWGLEPGSGGGGPTPTRTLSPSVTLTASVTITSSRTPTATLNSTATNTPSTTATNTKPVTFQPPTNTATASLTTTSSRTPTATPNNTATSMPRATATSSQPAAIKVQIENGGADNAQQSQFRYLIVNTGAVAQSNISVRIYFQLDGTQAISKYVIEKYWDQSGVASISAPVQTSGNIYYYMVSYGTASLAPGASWQFQGALHLSDWTNNFSAANDWWHTGYAIGSLPTTFIDTNNIPAYVGSTLVWGVTP